MIVLFITNYLPFTIKRNGLPHNNQFKLNRSPYNINKHQTFFNLFLNDLFILSQLFAALPKIKNICQSKGNPASKKITFLHP